MSETPTPIDQTRDETDIVTWLRNYGDSLLHWRRGVVVIESHYAKQFQEIGGDLDALVSHFEDNCEIDGAIESYLREKNSA